MAKPIGRKFVSNTQEDLSEVLKHVADVIAARKKQVNEGIQIDSSYVASLLTKGDDAILKKIGEEITESLNGISVRLWNVYGIEKNLEKSHVITDFILKGFEYRKIKMITSGEEKRDFLYAEDCCRGFEIIMKKFHHLVRYKIIDLNYGKYTKIINVAQIIKDIFFKNNLKVKIIKGKNLDIVQKNLLNSSSKILRKYWKPKFNLIQGIQEVFKHYKNVRE
jgi:nucleoside-diphosphate-sugar epimerase